MLPILTDSKVGNYDLIFIIISKLTKIIDNKLVKVIINILSFVEIIISKVIRYYGLLDFIIINQKLLFIFQFKLLLY